MVLPESTERDALILKQINDQMGCLSVPLIGSIFCIEVPVYRFGSPFLEGTECCRDFSVTSDEGQTLLDSLLLAKWEDLAWKDRLLYDITACPTKAANGGKRFFIQLNENMKIEKAQNGSTWLSDPFVFNITSTLTEDMLFCLEMGDKKKPVLVPSAPVPKNSILVIGNATPIEYGHVFLVPNHSTHPVYSMDSLESMVLVASEIRNCSFRIFYDQYGATKFGHAYFEAFYFANWMPVERMPVTYLFDAPGAGIAICEIVGYPIRTLMFSGSKNLKLLAIIVSESCTVLNEQNISFNILISDCGKKIFVFFQNQEAGDYLSAWECGGHFVFTTPQEFDQANEDDIVQRMAAASLNDVCFQVMKDISCSIACKLVPTELDLLEGSMFVAQISIGRELPEDFVLGGGVNRGTAPRNRGEAAILNGRMRKSEAVRIIFLSEKEYVLKALLRAYRELVSMQPPTKTIVPKYHILSFKRLVYFLKMLMFSLG